MENKKSVLEVLQAEADEANLALEMYRLMAEKGAALERQMDDKSSAADYQIPDDVKERCLEKIRSIQKKQKRSKMGKRVLSVLNKVAVIALVLLIVSAVLVTRVEALRVPVFNFVLQNFDDRLSLVLVEGSEIKAAPTWIPEGYKLTNASATGTKEYENGEGGYISFSYDDLSTSIAIDNEGQAEFIEVSGKSVLIYERDNTILAIWVINEKEIACTLCLYYESLDTAIKIIENVK